MRAWLAAVQPVQGGDLACLRQGRIVEDGVAQILDRSAVVDEDLADVDELRRALPGDVDPEELACLPMEQELEHTAPPALIWTRESSRNRATPTSYGTPRVSCVSVGPTIATSGMV